MSKPSIQPLRRLLGQARKRHTVMVLSGPDEGVKHFSLPAILLPAAAIVLFLGLLSGGAALLDWSSDRVEESRLARLDAENERLASQLTEIRDIVSSFEVRMKQNEELEGRFRSLTNLDAIPDDVRRLGVGGPPQLSELADAGSPSSLVREARATLDRIEELGRRADFQAANFEEMVDTLEESRSELDHLPSISPVRRGWFSSRYGTREDPFTKRPTFHPGIDLSAWTGTPVYATANGRVRKAGRNGSLGQMVEIDHGNGLVTRYGHNSKLLVKVGQQVERGDVIAEVGSTGRSTSPHCHYEVHLHGRHVNPWRYILDGGPRMSNPA